MKKITILYGISLAGLLLFLRAIQYRFMVQDLSTELYIGTIAVLFSLFGVWAGRRLGNPIVVSGADEIVDAALMVDANLVRDLGISKREHEVLTLIASGHSNQEIADRLFVSLPTIKKHSSSLLAKLEVERRTQAIDKAKRLGIIR